MKKLIVCLPALILLMNCTVQKRRHLAGYHVTVQAFKKKQTPSFTPQKETGPAKTIKNEFVTQGHEAGTLASSGNEKNISPSFKRMALLSSPDPDTCDIIVFRSGTEQPAKVQQILPGEIKYKKCDMKEGPTYVARQDEVFMIRYANGSKELFKEPRTEPQSESYATAAEHPDAQLVFILGLCGWLIGIGSIPAIVIGRRALREMQEKPGKYTGEGSIKWGINLGISKLIFFGIFFLFILFIFAMI